MESPCQTQLGDMVSVQVFRTQDTVNDLSGPAGIRHSWVAVSVHVFGTHCPPRADS